MARRGNFDIFGHYKWCVPDTPGLFILILMLLLGVLVGNLVSAIFIAILGMETGMQYGTLVAYPLMFIIPMLWASGKSRRACMTEHGALLDNNGFAPLGGWLAALLVVLGTLAAAICCDAISSAMPPMPEWLEKTLKGLTTGNFWINFICVSIFAPFFEEWLCRGMVLRGLLAHGNKPWLAIVISALFFAIIHMNPWQAIPAFLLGLLFGYVYYKTGSLKLTMLMHFTNNTMALVIGHIDSLKDAETWVDVLGPGYWFVFCGCILLLALVVLAFRKIPGSPKGNFEIVKPLFSE